ncbi:GNAT family N-acetyltransferase [Candidatus Poribacteria bacterium]|nr:GNAT family N-acetyltransferase [Candidatus Poribacteria bacterium]
MILNKIMKYIEINNPKSDKIKQFHNILKEAFPDPFEREDLDILRYNISKGSWEDEGEICRYHMVLAVENDCVVGGVSFYFFRFSHKFYNANTGIGMGSYLATKREFQGNGIGSELISIRDNILKNDAKKFNSNIKGLVIQVSDPGLMSPQQIKHDTMNPWKREKLWKKLGYRKLDFNFIQPSIREGEPPVDYLSLHLLPYCMEWCNKRNLSVEEMRNIIYCFVRCTRTIGPMKDDPAYVEMTREINHLTNIGEIT